MNGLAAERPGWGFVAGRTLVAALLGWLIGISGLMLIWLTGADAGNALARRVAGADVSGAPFADAPVAAAAVVVLAGVLLAVALWLSTHAVDRPVPLVWLAPIGVLATFAGTRSGVFAGLLVAAVALRQVGFRADGSAAPSPVADRHVALALAVVALAAVGAVSVHAAADPLVVPRGAGAGVHGVPAVQLADLAAADRVPRPRLATLHVRNLGPRTVRVTGVRPLSHRGIRVVGARSRPAFWTQGRPALLAMTPLAIAPAQFGELTVLLSDPGCRTRGRAVRLPVDVTHAGGTSRLTVRVPRCG